MAKAARMLVSALVLALALTAAAPSGAAVRRVQIYFLQGEQVVPVLAPDVPVPQPGPDEGPVSSETRALQQRLADLGFLAPSGVDGKAGEQTRFGVIAFQKWGPAGA